MTGVAELCFISFLPIVEQFSTAMAFFVIPYDAIVPVWSVSEVEGTVEGETYRS